MHVLTCATGFNPVTGSCDGVSVWVEIPSYPEPILPPLDIADGVIVSFAVISIWTLGLKFRLVVRAARM